MPSQGHPLSILCFWELLLDLEGARPSHRVGNHISRQRHRLAGQAWGIAKPFSTACECRARLVVLSQRAGDLLGILVLLSQWSRTPNPTGALSLLNQFCKLRMKCPARDTERRGNSHFWIHLLTTTRNLHFPGFSQGSTAHKSPRDSGLEASTCSSRLS